MIKKLKSLKSGTIIRTVLQFLAYVNQIVALICQAAGVTDSKAYLWASAGITIVITIISYWYNNDWTNLAQLTGEAFDMVKDGKITKEELEEFLDNHKSEEGK